MNRIRDLLLVATVCLAACHSKGAAPGGPGGPVESADILARNPVTDKADVKHVLIGWSDLAIAYHGQQDPRGAARSKADADKLAVDVLKKVRAGDDIDALMKQYSEDPGSAATGRSYPVTPDARLVPPFKNLSLRLNPGESGIVQTNFGWHVIKRIN
jgi:PPIC-type PPIASE domain